MNRFSTNHLSGTSLISKTDSQNLSYFSARVKDVIIDETHPEYIKYGKENSIGAIKFNSITAPTFDNTLETLKVAFPINTNNFQIPLKEEIVIILIIPAEEASDNIFSGKSTATTYGYISLVSIWKTPNHNALKDPLDKTDLDLGWEFKEDPSVKPLQPFPGDYIVSGRQGQSIRMSGTKHYKNNITDSKNNGDPFLIIANGQTPIGNIPHIVEDINKDPSSLYLTSNHSIPLEQSRDKRDAFKTPPTKANLYKGSQVLINGGRLFFNAKDEDIHFSTKEAFGITSKIVGIDAVDYIGLDANKIYLGSDALKEEIEPVIKGNELELFLKEILDELRALGLTFATSPTGDILAISLQKRSKTLIKRVERLMGRINPYGPSQLKSKKVFTE